MTQVGVKTGGRGCPKCGGHNTYGIVKAGGQFCDDCGHKWVPCAPHCKGYRYEIDKKVVPRPTVYGCENCGVPDHLAEWWAEAWGAVYKEMATQKVRELNSKVNDPLGEVSIETNRAALAPVSAPNRTRNNSSARATSAKPGTRVITLPATPAPVPSKLDIGKPSVLKRTRRLP